jgi:hypothetical protein
MTTSLAVHVPAASAWRVLEDQDPTATGEPDDGTNVSIKMFYSIGMSQIAVHTDGVLQWVMTDHLSSALVSASVDGTLVNIVTFTRQ